MTKKSKNTWRSITEHVAKSCQLLLVAKANKGTITGVALGAAAAPLMLPVVGFTAGGVAAGSVAAATQSAVYGAYTCGVFSILQSAGTGAAGAVATVAVGGGCSGGLIGKVVGHFFPFVNRRDKEDEEKETAQCKQSSDEKKLSNDQ
jgi:Interferon-induced 6-16 family.